MNEVRTTLRDDLIAAKALIDTKAKCDALDIYGALRAVAGGDDNPRFDAMNVALKIELTDARSRLATLYTRTYKTHRRLLRSPPDEQIGELVKRSTRDRDQFQPSSRSWAMHNGYVSALTELQHRREAEAGNGDLAKRLLAAADLLRDGVPVPNINGGLESNLRLAASALAASPSSPASGVRVSEHVQLRLKWRAAARPPAHPEPMEGSQTFDTLAACVRFMSQQAADAEVISLTEIRSSSTDATASLLSALGEHP